MKGKVLSKSLRLNPKFEEVLLKKTVKLLKIPSEGDHFYRVKIYYWLTAEATEWNVKNVAQRSH